MVCSIDLSRTATGTRIRVAGLAGYMLLEDLLYRFPSKAEGHIKSIGYGKEWSNYKERFPQNAREVFLRYVKRDMGL